MSMKKESIIIMLAKCNWFIVLSSFSILNLGFGEFLVFYPSICYLKS